MNGPSEFHVVGSLKTWDIGTIHERIPGADWVLFEESSHMPHIEEPEAFLDTVEAFLRTID